MKKFRLIFWFRFLAIIDVLFSEKFELTTWNKNGNLTAKTKFDKQEIKRKIS